MKVEDVIATGGDERIELRENGLNKYFVNPVQYKGVFNRGSCTCNVLTDGGYEAAQKILDRLDTESYDALRRDQEKRFRELIEFGDGDRFQIFYSPSGSDLSYYPILFARLIHPDKDIYSVLTAPEELGTGSIVAMAGKFFAEKNQFGDAIPTGELVDPAIKITQKSFSARDDNGHIIDHRNAILKELKKVHKDHAVLSNLVIGSKSGIYDNVAIVPSAPDGVMWVVDMCQFRATKSLVHELIDLNCMVQITGSKFYGGPPFCGAILIPNDIIAQVKYWDPEIIKPFARIFSKYDMPASLPELRNQFPEYNNYGLLARWEVAMSEIEKLSVYKTYSVLSSISKWNEFVMGQLIENNQYFEPMPDQDITNKTIISFRCKHQDGRFLSDEELRHLHKTLTLGKFDGFGNGVDRVIIGQPVKYRDRSFIRIALGSSDLRWLMNNDFDFYNDKRLVQVIIATLKELYWK